MKRGATIWVARPRGGMRNIAIGAIAALGLFAAGPLIGHAAANDAPGIPHFKPNAPVSFEERHRVPEGMHVLSPADVGRYRLIFTLQDAGKWDQADREISGIRNEILLGHVLFQRYMHPTKYRSKFIELSKWMKAFGDHPGSEQVYKLSLKRKPKNYRTPPRPGVSSIEEEEDDEGEIIDPFIPRQDVYRSPRKRSRATRRKIRDEQRHIRTHLRRGQLKGASKHLTAATMTELFDSVEFDEVRSSIASAYFFAGNDEVALKLAAPSADRSRGYVTTADWWAGLAAWRLGRYDEARRHFEALASSDTAANWNAAAGAYWAARANLVSGRPEAVNQWLAIGAQHQTTFYGLVSARLLGTRIEFDWRKPPLESDTLARLFGNPAVQRAIALTEIGQHHRAEREIRRLQGRLNKTSAEALLALSGELGLPAAEMRLARFALEPEDRYYAAAAYPVPQWTPENGYSLDRALVFAFIRQESQFNSRAKSRAGARGLMQLMPATASFVARDRRLRTSRRNRLYDPSLNLDLGQRYLRILMNDKRRGNLFMAAAAYNGGPGNLQKWLRRMKQKDDPLLFIESIPARETRLYVARVITNLWIYRQRLGQEAPSLDAVAAGDWPYYLPLDGVQDDLARIRRRSSAATVEPVRYVRD